MPLVPALVFVFWKDIQRPNLLAATGEVPSPAGSKIGQDKEVSVLDRQGSINAVVQDGTAGLHTR